MCKRKHNISDGDKGDPEPSSSRSSPSEAMEKAAKKSQQMLRRLRKGKKRRSTSTSGYSSEEGKCLNQARPKYPVTEAMKRAKKQMQEKFRRVTQKAEKKKKKNEKRRQQGDGSGASSSKVKDCKSGDKNNIKERKSQGSGGKRRGRHFYPLVKAQCCLMTECQCISLLQNSFF